MVRSISPPSFQSCPPAVAEEDLYVYETNPAAPDEYRYAGRWEPMTVRRESIAVKGSEPRDVELRFTRHGPVIFEDGARHRVFALRAAWLEPGAVPYLSSLEYQRANNWDEFLAAMNRHCTPPLNYLFADTTGNIGWAPSGLAPIRAAIEQSAAQRIVLVASPAP